VLCHFDAPLSAAQAVLYGTPTIAPKGPPLTEVVACAKVDLKAGTRLDGIGGFHCYGEIFVARDADALLPIGLAEGAVLTRNVAIDQPIELDAVEFEADTLPLQLRREQDALFASKAQVPA
jgi:predicted homoserine dehydrogenase-like protein